MGCYSLNSLTIIITSFNRRHLTEKCLKSIFSQQILIDIKLQVVLVDDNSTDGTKHMVSTKFPKVHLLNGDGDLYWNRGMSFGFNYAIQELKSDFYLWLNDDTILFENSINLLLKTYWELAKTNKSEKLIVVCSTIDPVSKKISYGGLVVNSRINKLKLKRLLPKEIPVLCHTFEGNCVLIPDTVVNTVGNIDNFFHHRMGDTDYGLRATKKGVNIYLAPFIAGECSINILDNEVLQKSISEQLRLLNHPKGLPFKEWFYIHNKHNGILGNILAMLTYSKKLSNIIYGKISDKKRRIIHSK